MTLQEIYALYNDQERYQELLERLSGAILLSVYTIATNPDDYSEKIVFWAQSVNVRQFATRGMDILLSNPTVSQLPASQVQDSDISWIALNVIIPALVEA